MKNRISALLLGAALTLASASVALAQDKTVKIGALSDQSGLNSGAATSDLTNAQCSPNAVH
jgi:branched-chain amino acid transport system substrate-binding protein